MTIKRISYENVFGDYLVELPKPVEIPDEIFEEAQRHGKIKSFYEIVMLLAMGGKLEIKGGKDND